MKIRDYNQGDYLQIFEWGLRHNIGALSKNSLPATGLIIDGIAVGFLYQTDSDICYLENLISNPDSNKEERLEAVNLIINGLIEKAKELKFKTVYSHTTLNSVIEHAFKNGYEIKNLNTVCMVRRL